MKKVSFILFFLFSISLNNNAQNSFTIKGKIELLSQSKSLYLNTRFGNFSCPIKEDGSFVFEGNIQQVYSAFIKTDSSTVSTIWLEPGTFNILLKETPQKNKFKRLNIIDLDGPEDAKVYEAFNKSIYLVPNVRNVMVHFIDSIFIANPKTKVLPIILSTSHHFIGDDTIKAYVDKLNDTLKTNESTLRILTQIQRNTALKSDKFLMDFTLPNNEGKSIKLSDAIKNKKLILIDFWASWCSPCRKKHKTLLELYNKYASKGLEIISISFDDDKTVWLDAIKNDGMKWINVSELKNIANNTLSNRYSIKSIPFSFWIKNDRKIITESEYSIKIIDGLMSEENIIEFLK